MEGPNLVISPEVRQVRDTKFSYGRATWTAVFWIGLLLIMAGLADLSLALYPPQIGVAAWRFTALASVANGLPLPAVGLFGIAMASIASEQRGRARLALTLNVLAALFALGLLVVFASSMSETMTAAPDVKLGLQKSAFKTIVFALTFGGGFALSSGIVARWLRDQGS